MLKPFAALALLALLAAPAVAQSDAETDASIERVLGDPAAYREAFDAVQAAAADGDAEAFAEWVNYPITVTANGEETTVENAADFAANYDAIVTGEIADAIESQTWAELFVNQQGVMFGNGEVWLNGICKDDACAQFDVRVITIQSTAE